MNDHVNAPHLEGFLLSRASEFNLDALPKGRTRITGITWYEHNMRPVTYWRMWSNQIIYTIHLRVLSHIKDVCGIPR